jgi:orotidine-5'-phosphate decarboxylase
LKIAPNHFFLVPGVGAQGGSLEEVAKAGLTTDVGLLVNSSRGIIYAGNGRDFASKAKEAAAALVSEMRAFV